jgi:P-type E1-E2 ATPase
VSECIADFRDAGIRVWMLTGDKGATAKEIAYSCALLSKKPS